MTQSDEETQLLREALHFYQQHLITQDRCEQSITPGHEDQSSTSHEGRCHGSQEHKIQMIRMKLEAFEECPKAQLGTAEASLPSGAHGSHLDTPEDPFSDHWVLKELQSSPTPSNTESISCGWRLVDASSPACGPPENFKSPAAMPKAEAVTKENSRESPIPPRLVHLEHNEDRAGIDPIVVVHTQEQERGESKPDPAELTSSVPTIACCHGTAQAGQVPTDQNPPWNGTTSCQPAHSVPDLPECPSCTMVRSHCHDISWGCHITGVESEQDNACRQHCLTPPAASNNIHKTSGYHTHSSPGHCHLHQRASHPCSGHLQSRMPTSCHHQARMTEAPAVGPRLRQPLDFRAGPALANTPSPSGTRAGIATLENATHHTRNYGGEDVGKEVLQRGVDTPVHYPQLTRHISAQEPAGHQSSSPAAASFVHGAAQPSPYVSHSQRHGPSEGSSPELRLRQPHFSWTPKQFLEQGLAAGRSVQPNNNTVRFARQQISMPSQGFSPYGGKVSEHSVQATDRDHDFLGTYTTEPSADGALNCVNHRATEEPPPYAALPLDRSPVRPLEPGHSASSNASDLDFQTAGARYSGMTQAVTGSPGALTIDPLMSVAVLPVETPALPNPRLANSLQQPASFSLREMANSMGSSTHNQMEPMSSAPPRVDEDDLASLRRMQDRFNREDELALAKQEAYARKVQADLDRPTGPPISWKGVPRVRGSAQAKQTDQSNTAAGGSDVTARSTAREVPSNDRAQRIVVVKPPTMTKSALTGIRRPRNEAMPQSTENTKWRLSGSIEASDTTAEGSTAQGNPDEASTRTKLTTTQVTNQTIQTPTKVVCTACDDRDLASSMASLPCGHHYCAICIADAFKHALIGNKVFICCNKTPCPVTVATRFLPSDFIIQYTTKLEERIAKNPIYCPKPGCAAFIPPKDLKGPLATCRKCGLVSCSLCKNPEHVGVCPSDKLGLKLMDLADSENWIQCSRCKAIVERDDGCLHMTCRCGYEFCYSCGGPWERCGASCSRRR